MLPENLIKLAVVGCLHGNLDEMYSSLKFSEAKNQIKIDAVFCCGDFQV